MTLVQTTFDDGVATLRLNRPERHNSLVPPLLEALLTALDSVGRDARAIVLTANGRSFSTGGDARGFVDHEQDITAYAERLVGLLNQAILALIDAPLPVVAAVPGIVTGGALGLVLACDIVLLAPHVTFQPFYSAIGPSPDGGWTALLPAIIGRSRAAALLYQNGTLDAPTALAWGLAQRIVPPAQLEQTAQATARAIADKQPGSIQHTKRLLWRDRETLAAALAAEQRHFVAHIASSEARAGWRSFLAARQQEAA